MTYEQQRGCKTNIASALGLRSRGSSCLVRQFSWVNRGADERSNARCVVGLQNNPLYIKCFLDESNDSVLKFHYSVHCSLDAVEEKGEQLQISLVQETLPWLMFPLRCRMIVLSSARHQEATDSGPLHLPKATGSKTVSGTWQQHLWNRINWLISNGACAVLAPKRNPAELQEPYLGLLYPTEDYKVYG